MKLTTQFGMFALIFIVLSNESFAEDHNSLDPDEIKAGWRLLFDGRTTGGWRGYKSKTVPGSWKVENGSLLSRRQNDVSSGDIITVDKFDDFLDCSTHRVGSMAVIQQPGSLSP